MTAYKPKITDRERERIKRQHKRWITLIVKSAFIGSALGVITVWLLIEYDMNGLGELINNSSRKTAVTALIVASFASTFGMVAMGIAIMIKADSPKIDD